MKVKETETKKIDYFSNRRNLGLRRNLDVYLLEKIRFM